MNYSQIPVNVPIVPVANFQQDSFMTITHQGTRSNYQSSIVLLAYKPKLYESIEHKVFLGTT